MIAFDQVVFILTGILGGSCLIVAFSYFRESNNESAESGFFRFMSAVFGLIFAGFGITILAAPFAVSSWGWFPDMLPKPDKADALACLKGVGTAAAFFTCHRFFLRRPKTQSRTASKFLMPT